MRDDWWHSGRGVRGSSCPPQPGVPGCRADSRSRLRNGLLQALALLRGNLTEISTLYSAALVPRKLSWPSLHPAFHSKSDGGSIGKGVQLSAVTMEAFAYTNPRVPIEAPGPLPVCPQPRIRSLREEGHILHDVTDFGHRIFTTKTVYPCSTSAEGRTPMCGEGWTIQPHSCAWPRRQVRSGSSDLHPCLCF